MDDEIQLPERDINKDFMMSIESTFHIAGRGTVVTGTIDQGKIKSGDEVDLVGYRSKPQKTIITGIETFRKSLDHGEAGDNVGLLLRGLTRDEVQRGQIVCKPNSL